MLDSSTYLIGMVDEGEWDYKYNDDWRVKYDYFETMDKDDPYWVQYGIDLANLGR